MKKKLVMICIGMVLLIGTLTLEAADQCITYEGYKKVNQVTNGKVKERKCFLKYRTLAFGVNYYCKKAENCTIAGLQKGIGLRLRDIQRLKNCTATNPTSDCPAYKDILDANGNFDNAKVTGAIGTLEREIKMLERKKEIAIKEILRLHGENQQIIQEILLGIDNQIQLDFGEEERLEASSEKFKGVESGTINVGYDDDNDDDDPCFDNIILQTIRESRRDTSLKKW